LSDVIFSLDTVLAAAREQTGLTDFGDEEFMVPLQRWLQAQREEVRFSDAGRAVAFGQAVGHLATRLVMEDHFKRHPQIAEQEIVAPVFVVGLYRSGTTKLHRLLCCDPSWTYLRTWEVMYPVPFDDVSSGAVDTRLALAQQRLDRLAQSSPGVFDAHPMSIDDPEEDWLLMAQSFLVPNIGQHTPAYSRWLERQDVTPMYRYLHRQLQILQWQQRLADPRPRRFCLKAPIHLEFVSTLMDIFPDARVIFTHRDPAKSIASNCLMMEAYHHKYTDDVDLIALGAEVLHKSVLALDNSVKARRTFPPETFYDIRFADVVNHLQELMPEVYRYVGANLDEHATRALLRGEADDERHQSAASHKYDPSRYGLSDELIHQRTQHYLDWAAGTLGADLVKG
jgi:hypothetical protein